MKWTFFDAYLWQTMWNHAKKSMEGSKLSDSVFLQWDVRSSVLKTPKNTKTRETKTQITPIFENVWPIKGGTMRKPTSWQFRKCCSFWVLKVSNHSYWPSKLGENWRKNFKERRCPKKRHGHNFEFWAPKLNQRGTNMVVSTLIQFRAVIFKIVAVSFFCYGS